MTMITTNPIPPGLYWVDPVGDKRALVHAWIDGLNKDQRRIVVETVEEHPAAGDAPPWEWIRFRVVDSGGIVWDHLNLPAPNVATDAMQTSDDTVQKPDVADPLDTLAAPFSGLATPAKVLVWSLVGLVGIGGLALVWRIAKPARR